MLDEIDYPNPRKLSIEELIKVIEQAVRDKDDIVLTCDFNEVVGEDSKLMAKVLRAGNLIDVHEKKHGNACNITTYIRGRRRLDYCFISPRLLKHVLCCGFEAFNVNLISDHRGSFLDYA